MTEFDNPFAAIEQLLLDPPADGILITRVAPGSRFAEAGLRAGETIVAVDDARGPDWAALLTALRPGDDAPAERRLTIRAIDGAKREVGVAPGGIAHLGGATLVGATVKRGRPGWAVVDDYAGAPDWTAFAADGAILLRNSLGEARAGIEVLRWRRDGDHLHVDTDFRLGGDDGKGGTWDYRTRISATHRLDRCLSPVRMTYREGAPGEQPKLREVALDDGRWRGTHRSPDGTTVEVDHEPLTTRAAMGYGVTLLPLTMPQEEGATLTFCTVGEGTGVVSQRERLVCVGQRETTVDGVPVTAWCYEWRHYGIHGESERFYVSDDRRFLRVDWGPNYAGCWGEAVPEESLWDDVPPHVRAE